MYAFGQEITEKKNYGKLNSYIEVQGQVTSVLAGAFAAILLTGTTDKNLEIAGFKTNGLTRYYSKSRDNLESVNTDFNACRSQNLKNSKVVVFKDGVLTKIEETLNSFK